LEPPLTTPIPPDREFFTTRDGRRVPALSVAEIREVDRVAVEQTGPTLLQMMEHAGTELAQAALELLGDDWRSSKVTVLAGGGNNGAGGVCAARQLANRGVTVLVVSIRRPTEADGALGQQLLALAEAPAEVITWDAAFDISEADVVIDAVIGTGLREAPRARQMALIRAAQAARGPVLSLDVPSGVDADSGEAPGFAVQPACTLTLGLPKQGLTRENAGDLWLSDLGIPPGVFARAGIAFPPVFGQETRLRLRYPGETGN
jgi:NAD(P)H-hydrate epimerase